MLKSLSTQFAAALFFGPLGLAYSSVAGAVFLSLLLAVLYFTELGTLALLIVWPIAIVAGCVFVKLHNDGIRQSGSRLLLAPEEEEGAFVSAAGSWGRGLAVLAVMAVCGYLALVYKPGDRDSSIGQIVDSVESTNSTSAASTSTDTATNRTWTSNDVENTVVDNTVVSATVTESSSSDLATIIIDDQVVTPVIISTSSGPDDFSVQKLYVDSAVVNLRDGPGTDNSILTQVERGAELNEINRVDGWINVSVPGTGTTGWIFGRLVTSIQQ